MAKTRRVGVVLKESSSEAVQLGRQLIVELERLGAEIVMDDESARPLDRLGGVIRADLAHTTDLVVVLGGDGTLLSVTRGEVGDTPILGINLGTLGFLTEHTVERLFPLVHAALDGTAKVEHRQRLEVTVETPGRETIVRRALNDVVINKSALARMVVLSVHVDDEFLSRFRADGLIVATPTGSTAYNLSAGGPIVYPTVELVLITPICPHSLTNRPIALPMESVIDIRLGSQTEEVYLTLDGQEGFPLTTRNLVRVRHCTQPVGLITEDGRSYYRILNRKLKWGERGP